MGARKVRGLGCRVQSSGLASALVSDSDLGDSQVGIGSPSADSDCNPLDDALPVALGERLQPRNS